MSHQRERWLVSYADLMTLLFAFFTTLYALSTIDQKKAEGLSAGVKAAFNQQDNGVLDNGKALLGTKDASLKDALDAVIIDGLQGKVILREERRGIVLSLSESTFFASGSASLLPSAKEHLEKIAEILRAHDLDIVVEGHTDDIPIRSARYKTNWELSTARATAVVLHLSEEHHINPTRLAAAGYGPYRPIADNRTPEGRASNRRVDLLLQSKQEKQ
jgi:chemotaxis protein MotB